MNAPCQVNQIIVDFSHFCVTEKLFFDDENGRLLKFGTSIPIQYGISMPQYESCLSIKSVLQFFTLLHTRRQIGSDDWSVFT